MLEQQGVGGRREAVAARLKKSLLSGVALNGAAHDGAAENGHCAAPSTSTAAAAAAVHLSPADREIVRLMGQHLKQLGMQETVAALMHESGVKVEQPAAIRLRRHVLDADWDMAMADLKHLHAYVTRPLHMSQMKFAILEQKYLELLERCQVVAALAVLREELAPLLHDAPRVHRLSALLMAGGGGELRAAAAALGWAGSGDDGRRALLARLQARLPPSAMLPPRRLETLLRQAQLWQQSRCPLHCGQAMSAPTDALDAAGLLVDHSCRRVAFPSETRQVLSDHCDEVWSVRFSNNGRYLATGSKESSVFIWLVDPVTRTVRKWRTLEGHTLGAACVSWSPDDRHLAVVGADDGPDLWLWNVERGELRSRISVQPEDSLSTISWKHDSTQLCAGGQKGQFYICDLDGRIIDQWEGVRVRSLWWKSDERTILAADTHQRIRWYRFEDMTDGTLIREADPLIYFCLDRAERHALCTIKGQGLHLWDLQTRSLVRRFRGSAHGEYVVVSCFGGEGDAFVASGSEDGNVYVWHREREQPVRVLRGHTAVVNAVSWHPHDATLLASAADDGTVRLWAAAPSAAAADDDDMPLLWPADASTAMDCAESTVC